MGDLLKQIEADTRKGGRAGQIETALSQLDEADRADLIAALDNPQLPAAAIARALAKRGVRLTAAAITRHRRGEAAYELG